MSKDNRSLEDWHNTIQNTSKDFFERRKQEEENFFNNNPILKEFTIVRQEGSTTYRVYNWDDEDFVVFYRLPNGNYSMQYKNLYDKEVIKNLKELI